MDEQKELEPIQQANFEMSMAWKRQSYKLISEANDSASLVEAIIWCGVTGHATRGMNTDLRRRIAEYIAKLIKCKEMDLQSVRTFSYVDKKGKCRVIVPTSWVSKVLHILFPVDYPLVCDSHTKAALGAKSIATWTEKTKIEKNDVQCTVLERESGYEIDSRIWAVNGN